MGNGRLIAPSVASLQGRLQQGFAARAKWGPEAKLRTAAILSHRTLCIWHAPISSSNRKLISIKVSFCE